MNETLASARSGLAGLWARLFPTVRAQATATTYGWLPVLVLSCGIGLFYVAFANIGARTDASWAEPLFWLGLLVIFLPVGARLLMEAPSRRERIGLVVLLGMALFACRFAYAPVRASSFDEFLHWRTAQDILATGSLFHGNPLLPVSAYYPGLEVVTAGIVRLSGLGIFEAGVVTVGAARFVFVLALFLLFEQAARSPRAAGIATLIYMTNPKFLYFDAQWAYESLALPLAAVVLYILARRERSPGRNAAGLTGYALIALLAVVVTHHVTAVFLAVFLVLWAIARGVVQRRSDTTGVASIAAFAVIAIIAWAVFVATVVIGYLAPQVRVIVSEVLELLAGEASARELFVSRTGEVAPIWERLVGFGSVGLLLLLLPLGLRRIWVRYRRDALALVLTLGALAYPATLLARLTPFGADVATRTPEFLFFGLGFVVALAVAEMRIAGANAVARLVVASGLVAVIFLGGIIIGLPGWGRLPGPYLVGADSRSVDATGIAAAEWARVYLGPHNRVVADRVNNLLMGTYGQQRPVTAYVDRVQVRTLYFGTEVGTPQSRVIRAGDIRYLLSDRRLSRSRPLVGYYYDRGEFEDEEKRRPIDSRALRKFDGVPGVSRILDAGDIVLYDVRSLR